MAENLVSQPPLIVPIINVHGVLDRAWSIWFRDLYRRTAYKGGNSIDDNAKAIEAIEGDLEDLTVRVTKNEEDIAALTIRVGKNEDDIAALDLRVTQNEEDITALDLRVTQNELDIAQLQIDVDNNTALIVALDLRVTQNESDISQNTSDIAERIRHRGRFVQGDTYYPYDEALQDGYLGNAITETTDNIAPERIGDIAFLYQGTPVNNSANAKQIVAGQRFSVATSVFIDAYRVNTVAGNEYSVYVVNDPNGEPVVEQLTSFIASSDGWQTFNTKSSLALPGVEFDVLVVMSEPTATPVETTLSYDYVLTTNELAPANGEINHANKALSQMLVSKFDQGGDQDPFLSTLAVGDTFTGAGVNWSIQSISDEGTYYNFSVAPAQRGAPGGIQDFIFATQVATPITYAEDVDYWIPFGSMQGLFTSTGGLLDVVPDQTFRVIDLLVQEASASPDWFIKASARSIEGIRNDDSSGIESIQNIRKTQVIEDLTPSTTNNDYNVSPVTKIDQSVFLARTNYKVTVSFDCSATAVNRRIAVGVFIDGVQIGNITEKEMKDTNDILPLTKVFRYYGGAKYTDFLVDFGRTGGGGGSSVTIDQVTIFIEPY